MNLNLNGNYLLLLKRVLFGDQGAQNMNKRLASFTEEDEGYTYKMADCL